jgi:CBS domain-containing protein
MSEYGVSSIPVVDQNGHLMGNISMADVRFVLQHNRFNRLWLSCSNLVSLALSQKGLESGGQDRFPVFETTSSATVSKVMQKLLATKTHRIWIVDADQKLEGVVSMTDIIRYLCKPQKLNRKEEK